MRVLVDPKRARDLGQKRQGVHLEGGTERFFEDPNEEDVIGVTGELAFAKLFGLQVDTEDRPGGDGGVDFIVPFNFVVDVKTSRKPYNLLVKVDEIDNPVDIYVLAKYTDEDGEIEFLGWQYRNVMRMQPVKDFGYGIRSHYMKADQLRPMSELLARVKE